MLNIFESQQTVRTAFQSDEARQPQRSVSLWRTFIGWLGRRRGREHVGDLAPSILSDVGLKRIGDIVVAADTPDCANDDCAIALRVDRAA